ncbi:MAG: hypothetical protein SOV43_03865 [Selenomonadaceae bacterium]|nr:hypothetical protein [Selenomonadaceae bacterium]
MKNVYALVDQYYREHTDAALLVEQDVVEQFLRRKAWHGAKDARLKKIWTLLSLMLTYLSEWNLDDFASLSKYDYQELVYRYAAENPAFTFSEQEVLSVLKMAGEFLRFSSRGETDAKDDAGDWELRLREAKDSLYDNGVFSMPKRRAHDEFYNALEHMEEVPQEMLERLNDMLDGLMDRISDYFHQEKYAYDMSRAMQLYAGPDRFSTDDSRDAHMAFWNGFWDYFLFDYHMLSVDDTPLHRYAVLEREHLSQAEQDTIHDLLCSKFTVFEIREISDDYFVCRDLFRDEELLLPLEKPVLTGEPERSILCGHLRSHGIMMLNYVTVLPATKKLRLRMKDEILRLFQLFRIQSPKADMDAFLSRESVAVRHVLQILANYAQLQVVPFVGRQKPIPWDPEVPAALAPLKPMLDQVAKSFGFSAHAKALMQKLAHDYAVKAGLEQTVEQMPDMRLALPVTLARTNGVDLLELPEMEPVFGRRKRSVKRWVEAIEQTLQIQRYDPRYLTEEGCVAMLYTTI